MSKNNGKTKSLGGWPFGLGWADRVTTRPPAEWFGEGQQVAKATQDRPVVPDLAELIREKSKSGGEVVQRIGRVLLGEVRAKEGSGELAERIGKALK